MLNPYAFFRMDFLCVTNDFFHDNVFYLIDFRLCLCFFFNLFPI